MKVINRAIGIDLGTTNSVVTVMALSGDKIIIHRDRFNRETTPSCVWKNPETYEIVVGHKALRRVGTMPKPIRSIKRSMGMDVKVLLTNEEVTPEQVSSYILGEMKKQIEEDIQTFNTDRSTWVVTRAVITVPSYFNLAQITATQKAGELAGLTVLDLLYEPTSVASYYCWKTGTQDGVFLVYDLGGESFDVCVLRCKAGIFEILAISGNNYLGGDEFDTVIAQHLKERLINEGYALEFIKNDPEDALRINILKFLAEEVKKALSFSEEYLLRHIGMLKDKEGNSIIIDTLFERLELEEWIKPIIERTIPLCYEALERAEKRAGITLADIDAIILAGGSTHIPLVREVVKKSLCADLGTREPRAKCSEAVYEKVDIIVALGAAIRGVTFGDPTVYEPKDTEFLEQLENEIGRKIFVHNSDDNIVESSSGIYAVDEEGSIIGLNLYGSSLSILPNAIAKLKNLKKLVLTNNQFKEFPLKILELRKLNTLYLGYNQLTALPKAITELKNLQYLSLNANQFKGFPIESNKLTHFKELDLRNNLISDLPKEITELRVKIKWEVDKKNDGIYLEGNPFENPPIEIVKRGIETIKIYFNSLKGENQALNEVKVLLVGDGGAGKTSLVKRALGEKFNKHEPQTHGININSWYVIKKNSYYKVNFWDFGGQEIMHATHQFFLSKRSLYILVLDGRKDEKTEYWLKHIESFGGNSPILVVLNKIDDNPGFDVNRRFFREKYKGIKGFFRVSCAEGKGIEEFSESLCEALENIEIIKTTWAKSWFNVKTQLEKISENFISYDKYLSICEMENITEKPSQETLIDFLNDLGVALHFKDFELLDTYVLDPKWVTTAVYRIINSKQLAESNGVLKLNLLEDILRRERGTDYFYPRNKYRYIIDLMLKFELCYKIDNTTVLIPDLIEIQEPLIDFDYSTSLKFLLAYDFLPKSVMPRFIVKMHIDIKEYLRWRTGVVLEDKVYKCTAIVKADERDEKIYIYVNGAQKRDYFSIIRKTFTDINSSFEKMTVTELVPLPGHEDITVEYRELIGYELTGRDELFIGKLRKSYSVKMLLNGIEKQEDRIIQKAPRIINVQGNYYEQSECRDDDTNMTNTTKIKILFLGANSSGSQLRLDEEVKKIQSNLKLAKERENLEMKQEWAVTIDTLIQAILDESPNLIHFSGHGKQEGIILQNEIGEPKTVTGEALVELFKLFKDTVKCVVLNSCFSEHQAHAIKLHLPHVVGMKANIPDKAAIAFSTGFYKAIGAGRDIPFAFELGVAAIKLEGVSGDYVPVLL